MKSIYILFVAAVLVASCNPDTIDFSNGGEDATTRAMNSGELLDATDTLSIIGSAMVPIVYADLGVSQTTGVKVQIPVIPDDYIESAGLTAQFKDLAKFTSGEESYVNTAREITKTCIGILDTHLVNNSDIVFLIDATASMQDDIDNVKRGVTTIIKHVQMHENVRVGVAIYRDKSDGGAVWYDYLQLTYNYDSVIQYVNAIAPCCGGVDWPESVYDGAYLTLDTMDWREDSPKMIMLIGDAPALLGDRTEHTLEDVVNNSKAHGVQMNFYPIIITTEIALNPIPVVRTLNILTKMYPNPSAGAVTVELAYMAAYSWQVTDMGGSVLQTGSGFTNRIQLDLSDLPNGVYNVQVTRDALTENKLIVVAH